MVQVFGKYCFRTLSLSLKCHDVIKSVVQVSNLDPTLTISVMMWWESTVHEFQVCCMHVNNWMLILLLLMNRRYDDVLPALGRVHLALELHTQS